MFGLFEVPPRKQDMVRELHSAAVEKYVELEPTEVAQLLLQVSEEVVEGMLLELYGPDALALLEALQDRAWGEEQEEE